MGDLRAACAFWCELGLSYEEAQTRLLIGSAFRVLGGEEGCHDGRYLPAEAGGGLPLTVALGGRPVLEGHAGVRPPSGAGGRLGALVGVVAV